MPLVLRASVGCGSCFPSGRPYACLFPSSIKNTTICHSSLMFTRTLPIIQRRHDSRTFTCGYVPFRFIQFRVRTCLVDTYRCTFLFSYIINLSFFAIMDCASCGLKFNDGVQCSICLKHLDFGCAQLTETGWRKLGSDRRAAWKCSSCRGLSPKPAATPDPVSPAMDEILREIRDVQLKLIGLPSLIEDIKTIKNDLTELKVSCDFMGTRLDNFSSKMAEVESRVSKIENMQLSVDSLEKDVAELKVQLSAADQRSRLNNVEIKGVPVRKDENLFSIVEAISKEANVNFPRTQINYLYRVPVHGSKDKAIIVSFTNRYVKEEFVAAARARKTLAAPDIGFRDSVRRIYVNDHLNAESKGLLTKAKSAAREKSFKYIWVKYGKIHLRKNDTSPVFIVSQESDLNKIV